MSGDNILVDISNALDRLETALKGQDARLGTIELSISSRAASPTSEGSFIRNATFSPIKYKQLPGLPSHVPFTPPPSSKAESPVSIYETTITRLRRRFDFVDDIQSIYNASEWPLGDHFEDKECVPSLSILSHQSAEGGDSCADNDDAYTRSIYSSRPLSRLDLQIPPVPTVPKIAQPNQSRENHSDALDGDHSCSIPTPLGHTHAEALSVRSMSRSQSWRFWCSRSSKSWSSSKQSHKRIGMAYYAYENFGESLRSSISFRSKERYATRDEIRRLEALAPPIALQAPPKVKRGSTLRGRLLRLLITVKLHHPERIYFVA